MVDKPMARTCVVRLLGGFEVEVAGRRVPPEAWRHRRGADLVKLLALAPQHRLHRELVIETLWPDLGAAAGAGNLRKAVHYARRALGRADGIRSAGGMVVLWPMGDLRVDAEEVEAEVTRALSAGTGLDAVVDRFAGELLPEDRYADWTSQHREKLRVRRLEVLRASGRWGQVLDLEPADEQACRALMEIHLEAGDRQSAIRQFQRLREILRTDLGIAPEPSTVALFEQAVAMAGVQPPAAAERVQAMLARGLLQWTEGELDAAQLTAEAARAMALQNHLDRELGEASSLLGMVGMRRGSWTAVFRHEFASSMRLDPQETPVVLDASLCLAEAWLMGADSVGTATLARELMPQALDNRSVAGEALLSLLIGKAEYLAGHLEESEEWLSRAEGLYREIDGRSGTAYALIHRAEVAAARERRGEASRRLSDAAQLAERTPLVSHLRVRILEGMVKSTGGWERREKLLADAESLVARPKEVCRPCSIGLRLAAATACADAGEVARGEGWLDGAERLAAMWSGGPWQAAAWEVRAALRRAEGDGAQAAALLLEASNMFSRCGRPVDAARCLGAIESASIVVATGGEEDPRHRFQHPRRPGQR
jgi:DNA-binding SARP family transcriptional activator